MTGLIPAGAVPLHRPRMPAGVWGTVSISYLCRLLLWDAQTLMYAFLPFCRDPSDAPPHTHTDTHLKPTIWPKLEDRAAAASDGLTTRPSACHSASSTVSTGGTLLFLHYWGKNSLTEMDIITLWAVYTHTHTHRHTHTHTQWSELQKSVYHVMRCNTLQHPCNSLVRLLTQQFGHFWACSLGCCCTRIN